MGMDGRGLSCIPVGYLPYLDGMGWDGMDSMAFLDRVGDDEYLYTVSLR